MSPQKYGATFFEVSHFVQYEVLQGEAGAGFSNMPQYERVSTVPVKRVYSVNTYH